MLQSDPFLARKCWLPDRVKIGETEHLAVTFYILFNIDSLSFYKNATAMFIPWKLH